MDRHLAYWERRKFTIALLESASDKLRLFMIAEERTADRRVPYLSFLVRFWLIRQIDGEEALTAEIHSVQSGETWRFEDLEATLTFWEEHKGDSGVIRNRLVMSSSVHFSKIFG